MKHKFVKIELFLFIQNYFYGGITMYKFISYPLKQDDPVWPGCSPVAITPGASISKGDVYNAYNFEMNNHIGTHYDAPIHFVANGVPITKLPIDRFIFERPLLLDIKKESMEKVTAEELAAFSKEIAGCDLLMVRTGFSKYRVSDKDAYVHRGPAFSSGAAKYLLDNFPNLKALALDTISLASYSDLDDGVPAHHYMLGAHHDRFVCIIEDVDMRDLTPGKIARVFAMPLLIEGLDSGPVTMVAELK